MQVKTLLRETTQSRAGGLTEQVSSELVMIDVGMNERRPTEHHPGRRRRSMHADSPQHGVADETVPPRGVAAAAAGGRLKPPARRPVATVLRVAEDDDRRRTTSTVLRRVPTTPLCIQ